MPIRNGRAEFIAELGPPRGTRPRRAVRGHDPRRCVRSAARGAATRAATSVLARSYSRRCRRHSWLMPSRLPSARAGVSVDEAVVADLVTESVTQPGSLPLLQFALAELYYRRFDGRIGSDVLAAVGGMAGSIGRRAEEVYESLDVLVAGGRALSCSAGSSRPARAPRIPGSRARFSELPAGVRAVADRYADARLLRHRSRPGDTSEPTVEIAHEALLTCWSRLGCVGRCRPQVARPAAAPRRRGARVGRTRSSSPPTSTAVPGWKPRSSRSTTEGRTVSELEESSSTPAATLRDSEIRSARRTARRLRRLLIGVSVLLVLAMIARDAGLRRAAPGSGLAAGCRVPCPGQQLDGTPQQQDGPRRAARDRGPPHSRPARQRSRRCSARSPPRPGCFTRLYPEVWGGGDGIMLDNETLLIAGAHRHRARRRHRDRRRALQPRVA